MDNLAYIDDRGYEILNGKMVSLSPRANPRHSEVSGNIFAIFHRHLRGKKCRAYMESPEVYFSENDVVVPDVFVVCDPGKIQANHVVGAPDIIVEVLSPSTAKNDRDYKKNLYANAGVKEYWIVDAKSQIIEVFSLVEGKLEFNDLYAVHSDYELKKLSEEARAAVKFKFNSLVLKDLEIDIAEVFE
ncbi:MAG: Uma2 family endonuclease [Oscillospiraceae bacterium]|nr:Uma2 family endonuclease [Oscillospiraceae bacterium]